MRLFGPLGAYTVSTGFALLALGFALCAKETLQPKARVPFSVRGSSPLGFLRLFRSGKIVAALAMILALQTLHDGEGDVWQVYGGDVHGWGTRDNFAASECWCSRGGHGHRLAESDFRPIAVGV